MAYDPTRRWALVDVYWTGGGLCGNGGLRLMLKNRGGVWRGVALLSKIYN